MKIISLLFIFISANYNHDIQVANFKIHQEAESIFLKTNFDLEDILSELKVPKSELTADLLEEYLNIQTEFKFDGNRFLAKVKTLNFKDDHLSIHSEFTNIQHVIQSLEIKNTCFHSMPNYSNIIEIRLNGQERDFLMNSERTLIQVQL